MYPRTLINQKESIDAKTLEKKVFLLEADFEQKPELSKYIARAAFDNAKNRYVNVEVRKYENETNQLKKLAEEKPGRVHMAILFEDENKYPFIVGIQNDLETKEIYQRVYFPILFCSLDAVSQVASRSDKITFISSSNNLEDYAWDLLLLDKEMMITFNQDVMKPEDFIALGWQGILSNDIFSLSVKTLKRFNESY